MTKHQQLILTIIQNSPEHLTAEKIYLLAKQQSPKISMGTVYRCLGLLVQEGRIRKVSVFGKTDYYDKNCEKHDHLLCVQCGKIRDVELQNLLSLLQRETGEKILSYDLNLHYICSECRKQNT